MKKQPAYTEEQIAILASNPYTRSVSAYRISFTVEFKRYLLKERERTGHPWKEIFIKAGYGPELLDKRHRDGIIREVRAQAASPQGLHAPASKQKGTPSEKEQLRKSVRELKDEVEILNQKIEFLKKTLMIRKQQELQK